MIWRTIASPRPVRRSCSPGVAGPRQKRSKTRAWSSARMPGPWSRTAIRCQPDGIGEQVADGPAQRIRVADHLEAFDQAVVDGHPPGGGELLELLAGLAGDRR